MVGVGLWAALLANRKPVMMVLVPGSFLVMMTVGAAAGFAGIKLPLVEAAILTSVFVIGGLLMATIRLPAASAMAVVGLFVLFHGYAHAIEAPEAAGGAYMLGFLTASALLQVVGLGLGWVVRRASGDLGWRAVGGLVLAGGALALITN
jgi:urease accessory protein